MIIKTKQQATEVFGSNMGIAEALKITKQAISQWPEVLPLWLSDRLVGAAFRVGKMEQGNQKEYPYGKESQHTTRAGSNAPTYSEEIKQAEANGVA